MTAAQLLIRAASHFDQIATSAIRPGNFADLLEQVDYVLRVCAKYLNDLYLDGQPTELYAEWETQSGTPFEAFVLALTELENVLSLSIDESINSGRIHGGLQSTDPVLAGHALPDIPPEYRVRILSAVLLFTKSFFSSSILELTAPGSYAEQAIAIMHSSSVAMTRPELIATLSVRAQDAVGRCADVPVPAALPSDLHDVLRDATIVDVSAALSNAYAEYGAALIKIVRLQADGRSAIAPLDRIRYFLESSIVVSLPQQPTFLFDGTLTYASVIAATASWRTWGSWVEVITHDNDRYALNLPHDFSCFSEFLTTAHRDEYVTHPMLYTIRHSDDRARSSRVISCRNTVAKVRQLEADLLADRALHALNERYLLAILAADNIADDVTQRVRDAARARGLTDPSELVKTAAITYFVFDLLGDPSPGREAIAAALIRAMSDLTSPRRGAG